MHSEKKITVFSAVFSLLFGLLFAAFGILALQHDDIQWVETDAQVLDITSVWDADGDLSYRTVLRYTDQNGITHETTCDCYDSAMQIGGSFPVQYDPDAPDNVQIGDAAFLPYVFIGVGALSVAAGVIRFLRTVKVPKEEKKKENDTPWEL